MVRDAVANSGKSEFNLSTYGTCVFAYCATLPQFQALGLEPVPEHQTIKCTNIPHTHFHDPELARTYVSGPLAVVAFLEIGLDEDYGRQAAFAYGGSYAEYQKTGNSAISTESILAKIDEKLAELV